MASRRKIIRKKVIALLKNRTEAGDRVYANSTVPAWQEELPVILVYPRSEPNDKFNEAPRELRRHLLFSIEVIAKGSEEPFAEEDNSRTVSDILDDIADQVEQIMHKDDTLGCDASGKAIVDDLILTNTEFDFEGDGSIPLGSATLTFDLTYYTFVPESSEKQGGLVDFEEAAVDWHIGHNDSPPDLTEVEAEDLIEIPDA